MVTHSRAADGSRRLRSLNRPRPLRVEAGKDGGPVAVHLSIGRCVVKEVLETWRIDEEWWRKRPVSRLYFNLLLEAGQTMTVYKNLISKRWAMQAY